MEPIFLLHLQLGKINHQENGKDYAVTLSVFGHFGGGGCFVRSIDNSFCKIGQGRQNDFDRICRDCFGSIGRGKWYERSQGAGWSNSGRRRICYERSPKTAPGKYRKSEGGHTAGERRANRRDGKQQGHRGRKSRRESGRAEAEGAWNKGWGFRSGKSGRDC